MAIKKHGKVYAVFFNDGWVKVGRSMRPENRIQSHILASRMRGAEIVEAHVSCPLKDYSAAESALISYCTAKYTKTVGNEWFSDVNREELKRWMDSAFIEVREDDDFVIDKSPQAIDIAAADRFFGISEDKRWQQSARMASILEELYLGDFFGGELFEQKDGAWSKFKLSASIAIHSLSDDEIADLFCICATDPHEGINRVFRITSDAVKDLLSK